MLSKTNHTKANSKLYFGYGSNLWLQQMQMRCPTSVYMGVARLDGYRWIINERGYANVVGIAPQEGGTYEEEYENENVVFGLVYALHPADEQQLDINEGVPFAYTKEYLPCAFWPAASGKHNSKPVDVSKYPQPTQNMLVYIDRKRIGESEPRKEYVVRMNKGIEDAVGRGVPREWVDRVVRRFVLAEEAEDGGKGKRKSLEAKALRQAGRFVDESGIFGEGERGEDERSREGEV
jgi:gamma-glutamylcyclotransferase